MKKDFSVCLKHGTAFSCYSEDTYKYLYYLKMKLFVLFSSAPALCGCIPADFGYICRASDHVSSTMHHGI